MPDNVSEWLEQLDLGQYASNFIDNDIDLQFLTQLTNADLIELGVSSLGHRKTILGAIETLGQNVSIPTTELTSKGEAERRQLTVMFCDLAGSTELSQRLDPEDLREVNRAYQDACKVVIERYEGYVARYMGDGVLAYFGFPQAHEDDAERAIHAGLGVVHEVSSIDENLINKFGIDLAVRIGIATGLVVVGDLIGEAASQESAVVGETPNLAARLQSLASINTVVISPGTHALVTTRFEYENLGDQSLKGIADPVQAWRVVAPTVADSRFEAAHQSVLTPLVGREHEIGLLLERWEQAKQSDGQAVLLSGEAGIGKSRITETLRERITGNNPIVLRYQCSPYHTNSALHPIIEQLERATQFDAGDSPEVKLNKIESMLGTSEIESAPPLFAALMSIPTNGRYAALQMTPEQQKRQTLETLVAQIAGLSHHHPILLIFEDLHWADPTSLELLELTIERVQSVPVLVVLTYRPEFVPPWSDYTHITSLALNRFSRTLASAMVEGVTGGKSLPDEVLEQIIGKTDGVPLFVEELTKTILESGLLTGESDRYVATGPLGEVTIPATLHDSLMARLDRLAKGKPVAQAGAAIGREFNRKLLQPVCGLKPQELDEALDELVDSGLVFHSRNSPDTSFVFKHALVQEAAYESMLHSKRRSLHERIAEALLQFFPENAEAQPEVLAHHYTEASRNERAIEYWLQAGQRAAENSASVEAVAHLSKGLEVLGNIPESSARARQELDFQLALCSPIMIIKGWGAEETAATYARARELCTLLGETMQLQSVLNGEYMRELTLANFQAARDKGVELLRLGEQQNDVEAILQGHRIAGWGSLYLGELNASKRHIDEALRLYSPEQHEGLKFRYAHDPRVAALSVRAILQTLCGYPEQAMKTTAEALSHARAINHMSSLAYGLMFAGALPATLRHDPQKAREYAEEILLLSEKLRSDLWLGFGHVVAGWSAGVQVTDGNGVQLLSQGLKDLEPASPNPCWPLFLTLLAEAYFTDGETRQAISTLTEALQLVEHKGERVWEAGIRIFYGKVSLSQDANNTQEAERMFMQALDAATEQGAKFLELQAAIGLAGIWKKQSKHDEAQKILAPIYEWFTEGFNTPDLIEARELLEQLA